MTPIESNASAPVSPPRPAGWWIPWAALGLVCLYLLGVAARMKPATEPFDLDQFARIPVVDGGRVKPLDTVARVDLRLISQQEEVIDAKGDKQPAIKWYLEALTGGTANRQGPVWKYPFIQVPNDQVIADLRLNPRQGYRFSLEELAPGIGRLQVKSAAAARKREAKQPLDVYEAKTLELAERIDRFIKISKARGALLLPPESEGQKWISLGDFRNDCGREALRNAIDPIRKRFQPTPTVPVTLPPELEMKLFTAILGRDAESIPPEKRSETVQIIFQADLGSEKMIPEEDMTKWLAGFTALLPEAEGKAVFEKYQADYKAALGTRKAAVHWDKMIAAYRENKPDEFNQLVKDYRENFFDAVPLEDLDKVGLEVAFNRFAPFYRCIVLYILIFALCCVSWLAWTEPLRKSAFLLLWLTVVLHTGALIVRMYIQDRPPVTNLYSSAIFIGWGCVVLGLILEKLYPIGIGNLLAAVLGLSTTIVSHNLSLAGGDTMEMMRAVLDTNFWLSTHVTTVTFGYTATFVAGFIGIAYVARMLAAVLRDSYLRPGTPTTPDLLVFGAAAGGLVAIPAMLIVFILKSMADFEVIHEGVFSILAFLIGAGAFVYAIVLLFLRASYEGVDANGKPVAGQLPGAARVLDSLALEPVAGKKMGQMVYGVICFATLLSFIGTVLGGIWADQSWGRFWGWDPKENGAVLIVLWNALILHARWAGMVKDRGVAVLAIGGNMITAWSWFGTNQLGIGLHAYGFDNRLATGCRWFWLSQLVIIGLGCIPQRYWASATRRSFGPPPCPAPVPQSSPTPTSPPLPTTQPVNTTPVRPQPTPPQPAQGGGKGKKNRKKR